MTTNNQCKTCGDSECSDSVKRPGEREEDFAERQAMESRLRQIKHKILVLSGKGGVGKSTVAANLATALALAGKKVGILDVDIHGPSIPKLLHVDKESLSGGGNTIYPVQTDSLGVDMKVMSVGFMLREKTDAVIWRGPRKYGLIKQFVKDVEWGRLDYLIVDAPPGTGDEPLAVAELLGNADGAIIVTTPQEVSVQDVRRCVGFCRQLNLPVLGVVENMSGFVCPKCGERVNIFGVDGGKIMAEELNVPYLTSVPIEPETVLSGDKGYPIVMSNSHSETSKAFGKIVRLLLEKSEGGSLLKKVSIEKGKPFRIAVPITNGVLSSHFGHCEHFAIFDVDSDGKSIINRKQVTPPPHEPGSFPKWLHEQGVNYIIAAGMGSRAQSLFAQNDINVVVGAVSDTSDNVVESFLAGTLSTGENVCDH